MKEEMYREMELIQSNKEEIVTELYKLDKERLIRISQKLEEVPIETLISEDKLQGLLSRNNYTTALLNTLGSIVMICNLGSFLGIPILGNELLTIGKKASRAALNIDDFSTTSEYIIYLKNEINVDGFLVESDIETYIFEGIGGIVLLNLIGEKMRIKIAPNFINILKNIGLRPNEMLEIVRAFSKKGLTADLDPLFDGTLSHEERIRTIETLKNSLMTTFLMLSEIGAYDKIAEMREENRLYKKMLNL